MEEPHPPIDYEVDDAYLGATGLQAMAEGRAAFLGCANHPRMTATKFVIQCGEPGDAVLIHAACSECIPDQYYADEIKEGTTIIVDVQYNRSPKQRGLEG